MRKASSQGAMFAKLVADRAGISSADMDCIDFVNVEGRMTAGRLAELTGLTTGAITGVVDRLEKAGFVRRERDETDRRKVFIVPVEERMMEMGRPYELVKRAMQQQCEAYTDAELKFLIRYGTESYQSMLDATTELNGSGKVASPRETRDRSVK
ncbi:MarR family transcriptional regulator [Bradyrhizobium sp.]|uniref:MarR family winged helix-turn-helix transcriptional regulator n=1 Tax=Bradyrhizobium sp. TaxID=376 RepID=UPI0025C13CAE|nr:MarR family transcriptional regulator [Bradyrhizobium sp.]